MSFNSFSTTIVANPSIPTTAPGNMLTLTVNANVKKSLTRDITVGMHLEVNDGDDGHGEHEPIPNTELQFSMNTADAKEFADLFQQILSVAVQAEMQNMQLMVDFKSAQLSCAKGEIDKIVVTLLPGQEAIDGLSGLDFNIKYISLEGDEVVVHELDQIELMFPLNESEHMEFFRTIAGGNHKFTSSIEFSCVGFSTHDLANRLRAAISR